MLCSPSKEQTVKIIKASFVILEYPDDPLGAIERAARTCYKSEDKIEPSSDVRLVKHLIEREHEAMLEFGGFASVKFIVDRGVTHELVRHRLCSFGQESTRYCDYNKGKFGEQITVVDPSEACPLMGPSSVDAWKSAMAFAEEAYRTLRRAGVPAEIARGVLPQSLKAEIVVGANTREWRHIFKLRTSKRAHPQMREVMLPLLAEFRRRTPVLWDDVGPSEPNPV